MKEMLFGCMAVLMLAGCGPTIKTADYTFTQTTGKCDAQPLAYGTDNQTAQDAGRGSTNSGGSGNTIIIIESSDQDAKSDPDLSGVADAVVDKLTGGLTDVSGVVEELAEPEASEDASTGNVVEVE